MMVQKRGMPDWFSVFPIKECRDWRGDADKALFVDLGGSLVRSV